MSLPHHHSYTDMSLIASDDVTCHLMTCHLTTCQLTTCLNVTSATHRQIGKGFVKRDSPPEPPPSNTTHAKTASLLLLDGTQSLSGHWQDYVKTRPARLPARRVRPRSAMPLQPIPTAMPLQPIALELIGAMSLQPMSGLSAGDAWVSLPHVHRTSCSLTTCSLTTSSSRALPPQTRERVRQRPQSAMSSRHTHTHTHMHTHTHTHTHTRDGL